MPLTLSEPPTSETPRSSPDAPAERLRLTMTGVRLSFSWLGVRRSLSREQRSQAADALEANSEYVSASKKLLDTKHPAFKAVTAVRRRADSLWKGMTLPFPESGIRLIRQQDLGEFNERMVELSQELSEVVSQLDAQYDQLREAARQRLGQLFNSADYPVSLTESFHLEWEFPNVDPPRYLQQLEPELYQRECARVSAQFDEAVRLAEQAFLDEFAGMVSHLSERLDGTADGRPKIFRDSAVENLQEFFGRFGRLNIGSDQELQQLVNQAQRMLRGVSASDLRTRESMRGQLAAELGQVSQQLETLLVDRPRRGILRVPR